MHLATQDAHLLDDRGLSESEGSTVAGSDSGSDSDSANSDSDELEFDAYDPNARSTFMWGNICCCIK